jgi:actin-like ATPase involved in cell morphogenesis
VKFSLACIALPAVTGCGGHGSSASASHADDPVWAAVCTPAPLHGVVVVNQAITEGAGTAGGAARYSIGAAKVNALAAAIGSDHIMFYRLDPSGPLVDIGGGNSTTAVAITPTTTVLNGETIAYVAAC